MKYNFDEIIPRENTHCVKYDLRDKFFGTEDVIPMWVADMDFGIAPPILNAIKQRAEHGVFGYAIKSPSFFDAIVGWIKRHHQWEINKNWISFTPGIVPALSFAIHAYSKAGDEVAMFTPVYHPFLYLVPDNGRRLVTSQLKLDGTRYSVDFEDFERKLSPRVKMLFLSNPHNPVGKSWTKDELQRIGEICCKHNIVIISDEIHSDLIMPPYKHTPMASISPEIAAQTVTFMAPSKTFNLASLASSATIISDKRLKHEFDVVIEQFHIGLGNVFGIVAMEAAYTHGDDWHRELIEYLWANFRFLKHYFETHIPEIQVIPLEGTYLVWLDCRQMNMPQVELKKFFIEQAKVGLNDGAMFGEGGEGFMRINIACPKATLEKALKQIETAVKKRSSTL